MSKELQACNQQDKTVVWAERISACQDSDQSVKVWCQGHGICEETFYKWRKRLLLRLRRSVGSTNMRWTIFREGMSAEQIHHRLEGEALICPICGGNHDRDWYGSSTHSGNSPFPD